MKSVIDWSPLAHCIIAMTIMFFFSGYRTGDETLGAFNPAVWSIGSILDFLVPVLFCGVIVIASILSR